ncbi:IS110 family transposase, partial [Streptococcus suis]|nr:IS110 family transposase [Streptococcus suis]
MHEYVNQWQSFWQSRTKTRNHSRQRGNIMRVIFGIDVSKVSSEVAILVNG